MVVLRGRRAALGVLALVAPAGCNALVGVDFGAAHLEEEGGTADAARTTMDAGPDRDATDAHRADAGHDARPDAPEDAARPDVREGDGSSCDASASPSTTACVIAEAYGVFVAAPSFGGDDLTGDGSRARPFATIGKGVAKAAGKRVYVCAATYAEQVVLPTSWNAGVYGGLACPAPVSPDGGADAAHSFDGGDAAADASPALTPWSYTGIQASVQPPVVGYALEVNGVAGAAHFEDLAFWALDASATSGSASSIAVLVNASSAVSFVRVSAHSGEALPGGTMAATASNDCSTSLHGSNSLGSTAGLGGACTCPLAGSSQGGNGAPTSHATTSANSGTATPLPTDEPPRDGDVGVSGVGGCTPGDEGAPGAAGAGGSIALAGTLTLAGWTAPAAGAGTSGNPGQGGGGGGAGGYAGGGGGAGGCGGSGGGGGDSGGASIAIGVIASRATFSSVALLPGNGGSGSAGGDGQAGQPGGAGGISGPLFPEQQGCAGGLGGPGGGGGGGAGGSGGHSVGIAWTGTVPPIVDGQSIANPTMALVTASSFTPAMPGQSGAAGAGGGSATGNPGAGGVAGAGGFSLAVVGF